MGKDRGVTLVFVHGMCGSPAQWQASVKEAEKRGWDAQAIDLKNNFSSMGVRFHDYAQVLRDRVLGIADWGREPILIGHSLGGLVVQSVVSELSSYHSPVKKIVLIGSSPNRPFLKQSWASMFRSLKYTREILRGEAFRPTFEDIDALWLNEVPETKRQEHRLHLRLESGDVLLDAIIGIPVLPERFEGSVLVVAGSKDAMFPIEVQVSIKDEFSGAKRKELFVLEHGHIPMAESGWIEKSLPTILSWVASA